MAKYTIELRTIIENGVSLGLDKYPIFNEEYRPILNNKIIEHFYFREIGFETVELFKRYLNRTMAEIMPYYNQLYNSELLKFNPLENFSYYEEHKAGESKATKFDAWAEDESTESNNTTNEENGVSRGTTAANSESENVSVNSDTPQGLLNIGNIKNNLYASSASISENSATNNGTTETNETTTATGTAESTAKSKGTSGTNQNENISEWFNNHFHGKNSGESYSKLLNEFRETFLNIDLLIINELSDLFMLIY